MAETKVLTPSSPNPNKQRRHKFVVTGGVGGIAGVLIIGGVIGIVSLLRNRAAKKQSKIQSEKAPDDSLIQDQIKKEDDNGGQVLPSLTPIMEEEPEVKVEKQIFNDNTSYQDDDEKIESEVVQSNHKSLWTPDIIEIIKDGDGGNGNGDYVPLAKPNEIASIIIGEEDLAGKETEMPGVVSEENSPLSMENDIHFVYEDDEEESEETETETEREGSEGTGDSSMESNSEVIWAAESIEVLTKDGDLIKETNKEPKIEKENDLQPLNHPILANGFENGLQTLNHPISAKEFVSRPSFFVWVVLALALLYHFFARHAVLSSE